MKKIIKNRCISGGGLFDNCQVTVLIYIFFFIQGYISLKILNKLDLVLFKR